MAEAKVGDEISTDWWPESVTVNEGTDQLNVTSTVYIAGTPECGVEFVSPKTGRVGISVAADMRNNDTAGNRIFVSYEVYEGSDATGTLVQSPLAARGVSTSGDTAGSEAMRHGNMSMVEGLTPGVDHYVRTMHQVSGGTTNDIFHRTLVVIPLP
jgi:hypothetical protein